MARPACRSALRVDDAASELVCTRCGLAYPVRDGIPVMLVDEARRTDSAPGGGPAGQAGPANQAEPTGRAGDAGDAGEPAAGPPANANGGRQER